MRYLHGECVFVNFGYSFTRYLVAFLRFFTDILAAVSFIDILHRPLLLLRAVSQIVLPMHGLVSIVVPPKRVVIVTVVIVDISRSMLLSMLCLRVALCLVRQDV